MVFWPSVPKWNQFSQGRVWASISWNLAMCGVWAGPEHIGDWRADTTVTLGAVFPQGMPRHAASISFMLLAATAPVPGSNLKILGEFPSTALLSAWEQRAFRLLKLSSSARQEPRQDWKLISLCSTLIWSPSFPFFFPWKGGRLRGLQVNTKASMWVFSL